MFHKSNRRLSFQNLERREVLSTMILESEPNDRKVQADVVTFDAADQSAELSGQTATRRDQDYFRFRPTAAGEVRLDVVPTGVAVTKVSVEDAAGRELFETEPNDGIDGGVFSVNAGTDVFIRVRAQGRAVGAYSVRLSLSSEVTPPPGGGGSGGGGTETPPPVLFSEVEGNDSKARANRVSMPETGGLQIQGVSTSSRDRDFFAVKATKSGVLNVSVRSTGDGVAKLEVETAGEIELFETEPNNGVHSGSFTVVAGQTYFFRVRSTSPLLAPYLVDAAMA